MPRVLEFNSDNEDDFSQFELELECGDVFSPNRTRSGCLHGGQSQSAGFKRRRSMAGAEGEKPAVRHSADGDLADSEENGDEVEDDVYKLPPVPSIGKMFAITRERRNQHDLPSSPVRPSSPRVQPPLSSPRPLSPSHHPASPTCSLDMDLLLSPTQACTLSSSFSLRHLSSSTVARNSLSRARLRFDSDGDLLPSSCPLPSRLASSPSKATSPANVANVNPFTPQAMQEASRKKPLSYHNQSYSPSWALSQSECSSQDASMSLSEESEPDTSLPAKRLRVSDMSITRYQEEFLELAKVASGQFGMVVKARHRLDGIEYAIKITKKNLRANSHDEKMAMNEVFAHAALMKNKHVVRYFNSWVERGQIYIQNEFCDGGSLEQKIEDSRLDGHIFSEDELHRLLLHIGKGLKYIHSRQLVHLDIKPGNIFLSLDPDLEPLPLNLSTDSGAASGDGTSSQSPMTPIRYKIGDLGHMASIQGDISPTEGDCRYMAPEFLQMEPVDPVHLAKADMFSTGMTLYEAASLAPLPRNSEDDVVYEDLKRGMLPPLPNYSRKFYSLLRSLVHKDPSRRLHASKLISNPLINPLASKSKTQLWRELHKANKRLEELERQVATR